MTITVYWGSGSPFSWTVLLALETKNLGYESKLLQMSQGDHKTPQFLALNPRGKVPVLVDGSQVISESLAILTWLEAQYPEPPIFGRTPAEKAMVMQAVSELVSYVETPIMNISRTVFFKPWDADGQADITALVATAKPELQRLDMRLESTPWLAGSALSVADLRLYPLLQLLWRATGAADRKGGLAVMHELNRENFPEIDRWARQVEALHGYNRTYPPHWRG